jgi:hypothetical protein
VYPAGGSPVTNIAGLLQPRYIAKLPSVDAWNHGIDYISSPTSSPQTYSVTSFGKDGNADTTTTAGSTTDFNNDILFSQGIFIKFPEGSQK